MKKEFIEFLEKLIAANPDVEMSDNVKEYIEILKSEEKGKSKMIITDKGLTVLQYIQSHADVKTWKTKDIAEGIGSSSRSVSGILRKLASDKFLEKVASDPCIYILTQKGKDFQPEGE